MLQCLALHNSPTHTHTHTVLHKPDCQLHTVVETFHQARVYVCVRLHTLLECTLC